MKRRFGREMALLCVPVLLVGAVGWLLSKRRLAPDKKRLLLFRLEKPTTLEAFRGADAVCVVSRSWIEHTQVWLQVQTPHGQEDSRSPKTRSWNLTWMPFQGGDQVWARYGVNLRKVPRGGASFGIKWQDVMGGGTPSNPAQAQLWNIPREQIVPFRFDRLSKRPIVRLTSVKVSGIPFNSGGMIEGQLALDFVPSAKNALPVEMAMRNGAGFVDCSLSPTKSSGLHQVWNWTAFPVKTGPKALYKLTGRIGTKAWPLAFQIEPFQFKDAKVGQQLHLKSWPAPLPKP